MEEFQESLIQLLVSLICYQVGPQAIYVVGRADDDESIGAGSEVSDAASWETVNDDDEMHALFTPEGTEEVCFCSKQ